MKMGISGKVIKQHKEGNITVIDKLEITSVAIQSNDCCRTCGAKLWLRDYDAGSIKETERICKECQRGAKFPPDSIEDL
jgi:hypothetical protein